MFEKFSISDIDSAGRGGEYTVQVGDLTYPNLFLQPIDIRILS